MRLKEDPDTEFVSDIWFKKKDIHKQIMNPEENV